MRLAWRWSLLVAVLALVGTMGFSVFAHHTTPTTMQVEVPKPTEPMAIFYPVPGDLDIPRAGRYRPSSLVVTWDGSQWRAFSNRTGEIGCEVEYQRLPKERQETVGLSVADVLHDVCHGALYDFSGRWIAGPLRTLYQYPARLVKANALEVDLGQPAPTFK